MSDDRKQYLGCDIEYALTMAQKNGHQIRVLSHNGRALRYADEAPTEHIQVYVKNNHVSSIL